MLVSASACLLSSNENLYWIVLNAGQSPFSQITRQHSGKTI